MNDIVSDSLLKIASGGHVSFQSSASAPHSPSTVSVGTESRAVSETALPSTQSATASDAAAAPPRALNPHAREFQPPRPAVEAAAAAPPSFMMAAGHAPVTYLAVAPVSVWPAALPTGNEFYPDLGGMGAMEGGNVMWPTLATQRVSPRSANTEQFSLGSTASRTIIEEFSEMCNANNYHMVIVHNLEPKTTNKDLLEIFYPMGAREAEMLHPRHSSLPSRRTGVVFFSSKAFAEVAVEKIDYFVPKGQHLPLKVRYCYPDVTKSEEEDALAGTHHAPASASAVAPCSASTPASAATLGWPADGAALSSQPLSNSNGSAFGKETLPWCPQKGAMLDRIYREMWQFASKTSHNAARHIVAVHGLPHGLTHAVITSQFMTPGSEGYTVWPPSDSGLNLTPLRCAGASALVWYTDETAARGAVTLCNMKSQAGQLHRVEAVFVDPPSSAVDVSQEREDATLANACDEIDKFFLREHCDPKTHLVGFYNLPLERDKKELLSLFSVHGALDAELIPSNVFPAGRECTSGVVFFDNEHAARTAVGKIKSVMRLHGNDKFVVWYLPKKNSLANNVSDVSMEQQQQQKQLHPQQQLRNQKFYQGEPQAQHRLVPDDPLLVDVSNELHAVSVDEVELAEKMFIFITRSTSSNAMARELAAVIVDTLISMRDHAASLSTPLVNAVLSVHERLGIQRKGGKDNGSNTSQDSADSIRNTMFMQTLARSMFSMFMDNTNPGEGRKVAAVLCAYLFQYSYLTMSPYELAVRILEENEVALRRALEYKRNEHEGVHPTRPVALVADHKKEEKEHQPWLVLIDCIDQMTSLWRHTNKARAKKDPFRKKYDQRLEDISPSGVARAGSGASLNTSARPTPRRVVAKVTPGSAVSAGERSTPGLSSAASPPLPRASLRSAAASHDVSVESAAAAASSRLGALLAQRHVQQLPANDLQQQQTQPQPPLQQQQQQQQQQRQPVVRIGGAAAPPVYTHAELMERTVYITKIPASLRCAQFRRLLLHFGEFNKVRLDSNGAHAAPCNNLLSGADVPTMWCSFVEFTEPSSAKAMIEYFRNAGSNVDPFDFLLETEKCPVEEHFTSADTQYLLNVRASPARNPIYGQALFDAIQIPSAQHPRHIMCVRRCMFGTNCGEMTIDTSANASNATETLSSASIFAAPNPRSGQSGALPQPTDDVTPFAHANSEALEDSVDLRDIVDSVSPATAETETQVSLPDFATSQLRTMAPCASEEKGSRPLMVTADEFDPSAGVDPENTFSPEYKQHFCRTLDDDEDDVM